MWLSAWLLCVTLSGLYAARGETSVRPSTVNVYTVYVGPWAPCRGPVKDEGTSISENGGGALTFEPRLGEQTRNVVCRDFIDQDKDIGSCMWPGQAPVRVRRCVLSSDCVLSEWSEWRTPPSCSAAGPSLRPAVRTRTILSLPQGAGRPCGPLRETNGTDWGAAPAPLELVRWAPGPWGPCRVHRDLELEGWSEEGARCGGGLQRRERTCLDRFRRVPLPDSACAMLQTPILVQRCEVPCPRDCTVGPWGAWGPCEPVSGCPMTPVEEITATGYRKRTRRVLIAGSPGGSPCGALAEVQPCAAPACSRWVPGSWGTCRLLSGSRCGPGVRERHLSCRDLQGGELSEEQCAGAGIRPLDREECRVACPMDCVLSPWGPWGACSRPCSSRHHRGFRYRNRTIVAPAGDGGEACREDLSGLQQVEECQAQGCQGYSWLALPWQACARPLAPEEEEIERAFPREELASAQPCVSSLLQEREVWCMENSDRRVADSHCSPLRKPETQRLCDKMCEDPSPCKFSPWSEWSPCPTDCEGGVQDRSRTLESGWERAESCGALRERRSCPALSSPAGPAPHWAHGAWSPCQLPTGLSCGKGIMTRGVWCSLQHHKVSPGACTGPRPHSALGCTVDCRSSCQLSDWSLWNFCSEPCKGITMRSRKKLGHSPCYNTLLYEGHECACKGFHVHPSGTWSACIVGDGAECGLGRRYLRAVCVDGVGRAVEPRWCRSQMPGLEDGAPLEGLLSQECSVPCEVDCRMSRWSSWGPCQLGPAPCGVGLQRRTRNVLINATSRGRPCGETSQSKVCSKPCEQYIWEVGGWSSCDLIPRHKDRGCGTGDQSRSVRCVELDTGGAVADSLCDPAAEPADLNACHVPCPGECVLSDWSEWSQCAAPCSRRAQRDRTRALLRAGVPGRACSPLVQAQPCLLNITCFHYHWRITPWGTCLPLGGSPCGEGMQQRAIFCERSDGRQVANSFCDSYSRPVEPADQFCYVDCPIDCELSPWEPWITKLCVCGVHTNSVNDLLRFRRVVTPASPSGRPCPAITVQSVACPLRPCYVIQGDLWSPCQIEPGATCGYGYKSRNTTCVRETDKQPVPLSYCGLNTTTWQDLYEEEPCYVDCYTDCKNSQWGSWSMCDGGGVRYRKRITYKPEGPPCTETTKDEEVFEYANCNASQPELKMELSEWSSYGDVDGDGTVRDDGEDIGDAEGGEGEGTETHGQEDYYLQQPHDQPEKTYLLFAAADKRAMSGYAALIGCGLGAACLAGMMILMYIKGYQEMRTVHKV